MKNRLNLITVACAMLLAGVSVNSASVPGLQAGEATPSCALQDEDLATPAYDHIVLVHRFVIPEKFSWGKVSVALPPAAWRVGSADGPTASAAQLRVALRAFGGLQIGGRCAGQVDGSTAYPCGFAVRQLGFAAQTDDRQSGIAMDWTSNSARARAAVDARQVNAMDDVFAPVPDTPRFVGLKLGPHQLGDIEKAFGRKLEFEIRAVSNPVSPSTFDRASGLVTLCGAGQKLAT
jgi:hypothetical protein